MASTPVIEWIGSPNYRNIVSAKHGVVFHWIVGYLRSADARFVRPHQTATQYGVGPDAIHQYVKDELYAPGTGHNGANLNYISIEHEAGYQSGGTYFPGSPAMLERSAQLVAYLSREHGWGKMVPGVNAFGHREFVSTMCPGTLPWHWVCDRANEINGSPAAPTNPGMLPANVGGSSLVDIDLKIGTADTRTLQYQLGVGADGIAGPITTKALQLRVGTPADGLWGHNSTKALQQFVGAVVDGSWGDETTAKTKTAIAAGKFSGASPAATAPSTGKLVVDGIWGTLTPKAEQRAVGVTPDGVRGPNTIGAEQIRTGATHDRIDGPDTTFHLQTYLIGRGYSCGPTGADRIRGANTVRALQRCLNDGRF